MRTTAAATAATAATAAVLLTLTGCSGSGDGDSDGDGAKSDDSKGESAHSKVIQPGRPGEKNETLDPDATVEKAEWNDADAMFVQMMIPHHAQALDMGELARTRADDQRVLSLARRINAAQGAEIISMSGWLQARGLDVPESMDDLGGHDSMPGLLTDAEMNRLRRADGRRFDELYLTGMIKHHQGAVDMAGRELTEGSDLLANELANDIVTGQEAEIRRMQDIRAQL